MLVRSRGLPEPGIIGDIHQKVGAGEAKFPYQTRKNILITDQRGEFKLPVGILSARLCLKNRLFIARAEMAYRKKFPEEALK